MRRLLLTLATLALASPASAAAHSLVRPGGAVVSYLSADATSLNDLVVRTAGDRVEFRDLAVDGGIDPGACAPGEVNPQGYIVQVLCPAGPVQRVRVDLGDREDVATIGVGIPVSVLAGTGSDRVLGGAGNDELDGGTGNDVLDGAGGDDVIQGGEGADELGGGPGDDRIVASDGFADTITCGEGADTVQADDADTVDASCETVTRSGVVVPPGTGDVPGPPGVAVGAAVLQSGVVRVFATATEPATVSASGFLDAAGLQLPIERLAAREVTVGGGGAVLSYRLRGQHRKEAERSLKRGKKVFVRLSVVATDPAGASSRRDAPRIRLLRGGARALAARAGALHPTPGDRDGDEVRDEVDNCPDTQNGSQSDRDGDGLGDACDPDADGDGIPNSQDNCDLSVNPDQADGDGNGIGDACQRDTDKDGVIDEEDNCLTVANPGQQDLDGDDRGDACDTDIDGDGIDDQYDNCPTVFNLEPTDTDGDGFVNDQADGDNDGIGTACDPDEATVAPPPTVTPGPDPPPLTASASAAARARAAVVGAGPIVTIRCSAACTARSVLQIGGKSAATGTARLAGAGTTYAFTRFSKRPKTAARATLVTTITPSTGNAVVLRRTMRIGP